MMAEMWGCFQKPGTGLMASIPGSWGAVTWDVREAQPPCISISTLLAGVAEAGDICVPR